MCLIQISALIHASLVANCWHKIISNGIRSALECFRGVVRNACQEDDDVSAWKLVICFGLLRHPRKKTFEFTVKMSSEVDGVRSRWMAVRQRGGVGFPSLRGSNFHIATSLKQGLFEWETQHINRAFMASHFIIVYAPSEEPFCPILRLHP